MGLKPLPGRLWGITHKLYLTALWAMIGLGALGLCFAAFSTFEFIRCRPGQTRASLSAKPTPQELDALIDSTPAGWKDEPVASCRQPDPGDIAAQAALVLPAAFVFGLYRWLRWLFGPESQQSAAHG